MAEKIKQYILNLRFAYPRSIFDMSPGELRYEEPGYHYPNHDGIKRGQYFAFTVTMTIVISAVALACLGHEKTAMVIAGVGLANIAATFIGRKASGK